MAHLAKRLPLIFLRISFSVCATFKSLTDVSNGAK